MEEVSCLDPIEIFPNIKVTKSDENIQKIKMSLKMEGYRYLFNLHIKFIGLTKKKHTSVMFMLKVRNLSEFDS